MNNLHVLDLGKNVATLAHRGINKEMAPDELELAENEVRTLTHKEVLNLPNELQPGSAIVVEDAHMGRPRTELSLAQPFEEPELLAFYDLCEKRNITLRLFPQQLTPRALNFSHPDGVEAKSDKIDVLALYNFLIHFPELALKKPMSSFENDPRKEEGWAYKRKTNFILNTERNVQYKGTKMRSLLNGMIPKIVLEIPKESLEVFGLTDDNKYKQDCKGGKKGEYNSNKIDIMGLMSMLSLLVDNDLKPRVRSWTQRLPGLDFAKEFGLPMSPFRGKGGVPRSNFVHHNGRRYIRGKWRQENPNNLAFAKKSNRGLFTHEEDAHFKKYRRKWRRALIDMFQAMKRILERE